MDNSDTRVISVGRKLIDSGNPNSLSTFVGYAIVEFEVDAIQELVERSCINDDFFVSIYDENQEVICSNSEKALNSEQEITATNSRILSLTFSLNLPNVTKLLATIYLLDIMELLLKIS